MPVTIQSPGTQSDDPLRVLVFGAPRRAKTTFAATWPSPIFLSAGQEGGDRTLKQYPHVAVAKIHSRADMEDAVRQIKAGHKAHGWKTVVVDSVTFYADIFIGEMCKASTGNPIPMTQQGWGQLEMHLLKWLMPTLHDLPLHVIWIALENIVTNQATGAIVRVEPMLSGKMAQKLPACADLIFYADQEHVVPTDGNKPYTALLLRTAATPNRTTVGCRVPMGTFPRGWIAPDYQEIATALGLPPANSAAPK